MNSSVIDSLNDYLMKQKEPDVAGLLNDEWPDLKTLVNETYKGLSGKQSQNGRDKMLHKFLGNTCELDGFKVEF